MPLKNPSKKENTMHISIPEKSLNGHAARNEAMLEAFERGLTYKQIARAARKAGWKCADGSVWRFTQDAREARKSAAKPLNGDATRAFLQELMTAIEPVVSKHIESMRDLQVKAARLDEIKQAIGNV